MERSRIMVVEDERLVALAIEKSLKNMGYEVPLTVASGEEAVRKVVEVEPDLVLMDIRLKGLMDGVEAAGMIRSSFHVPVVYLTAYSEDKTLERAKATEPFGYITKPFEERTLQATVEMALYKSMMDSRLWRSKERLQTILRCIGEGVIVMETKGVVEYMNPTAQSILLSTDTLPPGTHLTQIFKIFHAETREQALLPINKVIMNGENAGLSDLILLTKDQGRIHVDCNLSPFRDENGSIRGMVLSFRDVTERKKYRDIIARELNQAQELQKSLLPKEGAEVPGFRFHWFFHPSELVAGDIFGVFSIDARHVAMYMIDVSGHGIASAVNSMILNRFLSPDPAHGERLQLLDADPLSPREVVNKLNTRFSTGSNASYFSLLYGTLDTESGVATIVRAGQPYPVWQKSGGNLSILRAQGHVLGLEADLRLAEHEIRMEPGDRLFLYSDGLIECGNPDLTHFSEDRLTALIRKTRTMGLGEAVAAIDAQILQWRAGSDFEDDVCLQAFERI